MPSQVKEEALTRWGELGLRVRDGLVHFDPVLLDAAELPEGGSPQRTWDRRPCEYCCGPVTRLRVTTESGWDDCPERRFDPTDVLALEAEVAVG